MSGQAYSRDILASKSPLEHTADIIKMINLIAQQRCKIRGIRTREPHYSFAGKIICVIFDGAKNAAYREEASRFRLRFRGISMKILLQSQFVDSMQGSLLELDDPTEAIELGFEQLFNTNPNSKTEYEPAFS